MIFSWTNSWTNRSICGSGWLVGHRLTADATPPGETWRAQRRNLHSKRRSTLEVFVDFPIAWWVFGRDREISGYLHRSFTSCSCRLSSDFTPVPHKSPQCRTTPEKMSIFTSRGNGTCTAGFSRAGFFWKDTWICNSFFSSSTNRLIHAKDNASIQLNLVEVSPASTLLSSVDWLIALCSWNAQKSASAVGSAVLDLYSSRVICID